MIDRSNGEKELLMEFEGPSYQAAPDRGAKANIHGMVV